MTKEIKQSCGSCKRYVLKKCTVVNNTCNCEMIKATIFSTHGLHWMKEKVYVRSIHYVTNK